MSRLRALPRGTVLLGIAVVAVFAAAASNVPVTLREGHQRLAQRAVLGYWAAVTGQALAGAVLLAGRLLR